jgi:hypothetical protein
MLYMMVEHADGYRFGASVYNNPLQLAEIYIEVYDAR